MLHFLWETICLNSVLSSFFFFFKSSTDKENEKSSVQLQGSFDAALEYVYLVGKYISFFFLFSYSTILGLAANTRSKRKHRCLLEGRFQQQAEKFT